MSEETPGNDENEQREMVLSSAQISQAVHAELLREIPVKTLVAEIKALFATVDAKGNPCPRGKAAGITAWLETMIGKPIQRQHIVQEKIVTAPPMHEILGSPAAREQWARGLAGTPEGRAALREALNGVVDV